MEKHSPAYFRARIALIDRFLSEIPNTGEKNNAFVLLRNGIISRKVLSGKPEEAAVKEQMEKGNYPNSPLTFFEMCRWNTWFAMHPEKVAGKELVTTSFEFPVTIKGTKEEIINVLTPIVSGDKLQRIRVVKVKAKAKLKLLELMKL